MDKKLEDSACEYICIFLSKSSIKCGDIEDLESHIKVSFKSGSEWQAKQSPWISVNECPPMDIPLLLKYGDGCIYDLEIGEYSGIHYYNKEGQILDEHIVCWMPIFEV